MLLGHKLLFHYFPWTAVCNVHTHITASFHVKYQVGINISHSYIIFLEHCSFYKSISCMQQFALQIYFYALGHQLIHYLHLIA